MTDPDASDDHESGWERFYRETAVERARERTAESTGAADGDLEFRVADAFALSAADLGAFDTAVDVGLLHTFGPDERSAYTDALASVVRSGGRAVCLSFGPDAPDDWGPTPLSAADVRASFGAEWSVERVAAAPFETRQGAVPGVLAVAERRQDSGGSSTTKNGVAGRALRESRWSLS